jgi:ectoine hydroxylase
MGSHQLTAEERQAYRRHGFFFREAAFTGEEAAELAEAAERAGRRVAAAAQGGGPGYSIDGNRYGEVEGTTVQFEHREGSETIRVLEPFHHLDDGFERLIDDRRIVEPMRELIGSERISLFTDKLNFKRPREGSRFRWHQDSPYWVFACSHVERCPNIMLALDEASEANGCLRLVPGSHRHGLLPGLREGTLGPLFTDPDAFDASTQVPAALSAGSLVFFHPHAVHGSQPNCSDRPRRALVLTYQPGRRRMFKVDACREAGT